MKTLSAIATICILTAAPVVAEISAAEMETLHELDGLIIEGVAHLVVCEDAMRPSLAAMWQLHRQRIIRNIEVMMAPDSALLRYDELYENIGAALAQAEQDAPDLSPRVDDIQYCVEILADNEHDANVVIARLNASAP